MSESKEPAHLQVGSLFFGLMGVNGFAFSILLCVGYGPFHSACQG